ncbi:class I adenylate-forming enzyme family protein [Amycolatopsis taiwanensis]|uniref:class I adenylate-forming enzyme family protein n=1 Tax=Amycolatopsis taiwanensis TaxID=342230 RepID=UPI003D7FEC76
MVTLTHDLNTSTATLHNVSVHNGRYCFAAGLEDLAFRNGWGDHAAYFTEDGTWTYSQVHDTAARAVAVLRLLGVRPGDRVLIALPDGIGWVVAFLAVARAGCTVVPVNPELTADDHAFMAGDCDARLVITTPELSLRFGSWQCLTVAELMAGAADADRSVPVATDVPLYVHYTSGTTGRPKGVVHPQRNPAAYHHSVGRALGVRAGDTTLSVSKLFFTYGFCNALVFPLFSGSAAVLIGGRPTPEVVGELVARHRVSLLYAVPSWFGRVVAEGDQGKFASVRAAVSGGERFPRDMTERAAEFLEAPVLNQLGATEVGCAATANTLAHNVPGTIGRPVPGYRVEVRDSELRAVGDEVEGSLWVRGPALMSGYLDRPEATAEVLVDGWLHTRDRVVRHADGTYTHVARSDDLEMVGGITMSPMDVEDVLRTHREVREVAVAAVPDQVGATKLRAFVVPEPGYTEAGLEAELLVLARENLAPYKVPRSVRFVSALPRTSTGKLRRFALRAGTADLQPARSTKDESHAERDR